jgi:protein disulfide-isomerase
MPPSESPLLPWTSDFDKALTTAKVEGLPLYVYFTGSSWCIWCKKMDRELHNQDAFRQKTVGKFLFVKIDLPAGTQPAEKIQALLDTYHIQGVPTVIIISPDGQELARFRYQQMTPDQYADTVLEATALPPPTEKK